MTYTQVYMILITCQVIIIYSLADGHQCPCLSPALSTSPYLPGDLHEVD